MKQVYRDLCTYSADLFGINSALFELGGLIVMHDASGCNSTYNTHDEPRWYTMDSMIYVSGLIEQDAILGNDERLITDIINVVEKEHPKFIAISRSVLPTYMGTDVRGIAHVIEKRTGVPSFGFQTNGMDTYILGISSAFLEIAKRFCRKNPMGKGKRERTVRVNIIGVTPLDFSVNGNVQRLSESIRQMGFEVQSCWAMGNTLEQLAASPDGNVSLVVSAGGLDAAEYLFRTFGVPYVIGIPCGQAAFERLKNLLARAAADGNCCSLFTDEPLQIDDPKRKRIRRFSSAFSEADDCSSIRAKRNVLLIGEAVHCASVRFQLEEEYGLQDVGILCPLEKDAFILRDSDRHDIDEAHIRRQINASRVVIADPVYRRVADKDVLFLDDPHEAYSGRMYHSLGKVFVGRDAEPFAELRNG